MALFARNDANDRQFSRDKAALGDVLHQYRMERQTTIHAFLTGRHPDKSGSPYDDIPVAKMSRIEEVEAAWRQRSLTLQWQSAPSYYDFPGAGQGGDFKLDRLTLRKAGRAANGHTELPEHLFKSPESS